MLYHEVCAIPPRYESSVPRVSVVVPAYNQAGYLRTAIDSVLGQGYEDLEIIVVNDGSTDATTEVLDSYDDRVRRIDQPNRGAANALNQGIAVSEGELVCWLSADDAFLPGKVEAQVAAFDADRTVGLVSTGFDLIDADGRLIRHVPSIRWRHPDPFVAVLWENPVNGSTVMVRRTVLDEVGPFDEGLRADVDGDMWLRIAEGHRFGHLDRILARYRVHGASLSAQRGLMRKSLARTRLHRIRDGSLADRLADRPSSEAAAIVAMISRTYALRGMPDLGWALLAESRRIGRAPREQAVARIACLTIPSERAYDAAAAALRSVRRLGVWPRRRASRP